MKGESMITLRYSAVDGAAWSRRYKTLAGARKAAAKQLGPCELGRTYAVSFDGICKCTVEGATLEQVFGAEQATADPAPAAREYQMVRVSDDAFDLFSGEVCPMNKFARTFEAYDAATGDRKIGWTVRYDDPEIQSEAAYPSAEAALAAARENYEAFLVYQAGVYQAEYQAETAWLRAAENCPDL